MIKIVKEELIERALYSWINDVNKVEDVVIGLVDGKFKKSNLIPIISESKKKLQHLEMLIKKY